MRRQLHEWQLHTLLFDLEICDLCFLCCFLLPAILLLLLIFGGCCTFWIPYLCSWILNTTFLLVPSGTMCLNSGFLYFNGSVSYPIKRQEIVYLPSASRSLVHWSIWIVKLSCMHIVCTPLEFVIEVKLLLCLQGLLWSLKICNGEWGKRMRGMLKDFDFLIVFPIVCNCGSQHVLIIETHSPVSCHRLLWVESSGHSVPNLWNLRMGTWFPLANLLKSILIQLLGTFFLDRLVACIVSPAEYHAIKIQ
jgi:hypothetical protein